MNKQSDYSIVTATNLCFMLGMLGAHRFYVKKYWSGLLQLLTLGGLFIWTIIDAVLIITSQFKDADNLVLKPNFEKNGSNAGFWVRVAAGHIDIYICILISLIISELIIIYSPQIMIEDLVLIMCIFLYQAISNALRFQASVGKYCMNIIVTDNNGNRLSLMRSIIRSMFQIILSILLIVGFIFVIFHQEKRSLHDLLAKTKVIYGRYK